MRLSKAPTFVPARLRVRAPAFAATLVAGIAGALVAGAGASAAEKGLSLELNGASTVDAACRVTLVARNNLEKGLEDFGLDIVVFDDAGGVSDITALNLGALPAGKTRVLQYNIAKRGCDKVSALLVNDVRSCKGEGMDPAACLSRLETSSRVDISLGL